MSSVDNIKKYIKLKSKRSFEIIAVMLTVLLFYALVLSVMGIMFPTGTSLKDKAKQRGTGGSAVKKTDRNLLLARGENESGLMDSVSAPAFLKSMNNRVKSKRADTIVWEKAEGGMPLYDRDAVQTFGNSSAVIQMEEGNTLKMGESSLIIIRKVEKDIFFGKKRSFIVVMDGELKGKMEKAEYVEVTTPSAVARIETKGRDGKQSEFSIRVNPDKSSSIAVLNGSAQISAKGKTVELQPNQMTVVDLNSEPSQPRALPEAVQLNYPKEKEDFYYRDLPPLILFTWQKNKKADGYHFEIAHDMSFENVLYNEQVSKNNFSLGNLKKGAYYWRVSAVEGKGEGIFSSPRQIRVTQDIEPPELIIEQLPEVVNTDRFTIYGSTEQGADIFIDGAPVRISDTGTFEYEIPLEYGLNVLVVEAVDRVGNVAYFSQHVNGKF